MSKAKTFIPTEEEEQAALIEWSELRAGMFPELKLLFHIPNGGSRGKAEAGRFKSIGVKSGVPDLFLPVARKGYNGMFIEMKRRVGGVASPAQIRWAADLTRQGYLVELCCGAEDAINTLEGYLKEGGE